MFSKYEHVIKKPDKSTIKIEVSLSTFRNDFEYHVTIWKRGFRKKKFENICNDWNDNYEYRRLDMDKRREYDSKKVLEYVSAAEIMEAKNILWNNLKP